MSEYNLPKHKPETTKGFSPAFDVFIETSGLPRLRVYTLMTYDSLEDVLTPGYFSVYEGRRNSMFELYDRIDFTVGIGGDVRHGLLIVNEVDGDGKITLAPLVLYDTPKVKAVETADAA